MARLAFADEGYALASLPEDAKRLINLYAETAPADARSPIIVRSTPGLVTERYVGPGPILVANDALSGRLYLVSGTRFYRLRPDAEMGPEDLGDVGTPANGFASIAVGTTAAVVCIPPNAWVCGHSEPLFKITDPAFPGASSVAYIDGYFVFTNYGNSSQWFWSNLLNGTTFNALDFAYADLRPNVVRRVVFHKGNLWFMGEGGLEAWYDYGGKDIPFARRAGSDISYGCGAPQSVAECDDALFYLSFDGIVFRVDGLRPTRVSTFPIEAWIKANGDFVNVDATAYEADGHWNYVLSFTGANPRTLVYDAAEKRWHERASGAGATGVWRGRAAMQRGPALLIGDRQSGALFTLNPSADSDVSQILTRIATLPPIYAETLRAFMPRLELELEPGITPGDNRVILDISDDGGKTYRQRASDATMGVPGDFLHRAVWTRLGSFRQRVLRFTINGRCALYGADAELEKGAS